MSLTAGKYSTITFMVALSLISISIATSAAQQRKTTIEGRVVDAQERLPLEGTSVIALGPLDANAKVLKLTQRTLKSTDQSGFFHFEVEREGWYTIYAFCDRSETPGVDYVPSQRRVYLQTGSQVALDFALQQGASLYLDGKIRFVESTNPVSSYRFKVLNFSGHPLDDKHSISVFGMTDDIKNLGLNSSLVIIPAEEKTQISIEATVSHSIRHEFLLNEKGSFFEMAQGEIAHSDLSQVCLKFNIYYSSENINSALRLLYDISSKGFFVTVERQDLLKALDLTDRSFTTMKKGLYEESFSNIRSAYILTSDTTNHLKELVEVSYQSAFIATFFLVFVSVSMTYLMSDHRTNIEIAARDRHLLSISANMILASLLYCSLLVFFFIIFPGCRLVDMLIFTTFAVLTLIIGQIVVAVLPRLVEERKTVDRSIAFGSALAMAWSLAYRNLRRRKLRTTLSIISLMVLIFGFIALTSVSPRYGLVSTVSGPSAVHPEALSIRDVSPLPDVHFIPIPLSFIKWLESQPNITLVAPKAESFPPFMDEYGYIYTSSGKNAAIYGVIGIIPSAEAQIAAINSTIIKGLYLQDNDFQGALISSSLADYLRLGVGDSLYGFRQEFIIRGLFDGGSIEKLKDVNRGLLIPYRLALSPAGGPVLLTCPPDQIMIMTFEKAMSLPEVAISRVNIQLKGHDEYMNFAETIALTKEYQVWASLEGTVLTYYVGSYLEEKGLELVPVLMLLVILNIGAMMLGAVSERRGEIATLSSVGLNPTHIAALFIAEASVIGLVGGGLGYLLGISGYRIAIMTLANTLQVREKASVTWALLAVFLSLLTAIAATAIPAIKASTIVTPSLARKWKLEETAKPKKVDQPWNVNLPTKLRPGEVEPFVRFIEKRLRDLCESRTTEWVEGIQRDEIESPEEPIRRLHFRYFCHETILLETRNTLAVSRLNDGQYFNANMFIHPMRAPIKEGVQKTVSHIRKLTFEWNTLSFKVATPFTSSLSQLYTLVKIYSPTRVHLIAAEKVDREKLEPLKMRLETEGIRAPSILISQVNPHDLKTWMDVANDIVSKVDVVCVSGGSSMLCSILALAALNQNRMKCYVIDPRSEREQSRNPFQVCKMFYL